ncbi:MAG TPA: glycosyltransferase [Thermoanaerobaculia bacterium]|jgi:glycosyltransferase involved in cell wall biosynthesis
MFNVVIDTPDVVGERMAGPGIRAWHFARELAKHVPTTLVARTEGSSLKGEGFALVDRTHRKAFFREASVLIGQPSRGFYRARRGQKLVADLFDPVVLELRELYGNAPSMRQRVHLAAEWFRLVRALELSDLLVCAAAKQREFYERLRGSESRWLEVPFGIDLHETKTCAKPQDNVVIWGGGVWEWLDPRTAIEAIVQLNAEGVRSKLLFLGRARPNRDLVDRRRDDRFEKLLARGGAHVSANAEWVPYRERLAWLRSGKIAIMLHRSTGEADYSIRTRLFDAIAAGVPVVATERGFAAELVAKEGLGIVVPPSDVMAVARAVRRLLTDDAFHASCVQNLERIRPRFAWEVVTRPLVDAVTSWQKQADR